MTEDKVSRIVEELRGVPVIGDLPEETDLACEPAQRSDVYCRRSDRC